MRFKRQQESSIPEADLIPMLNVMMGILAFFVMITMNLTAQKGVQIELPNSAENAPVDAAPTPLIVQIDAQEQLLLNSQAVPESQLEQQIGSYLAANPEGFVVLQADPELPYEQVVQMLQQMKEIGGDRVSLAIE